jgi:hypothetical protein
MLTAKELKEEAELRFAFDPTHDYEADIDEVTPAWVPPPDVQTDTRVPGAALHSKENILPTLVRSKDGSYRHIPPMRYVRAVDPSGNIHPLTITTVTPGPGPSGPKEYADGFDRIGTDSRVKDEKRRRGWLILETGQYMYGRTGQEYLAWALAVADLRRKRKAARDAIENEGNVTVAQRRMMEAQKSASESMNAAITQAVTAVAATSQTNTVELAKAIAEAIVAAQGAKQSRKSE